jgi:hypothetical protein
MLVVNWPTQWLNDRVEKIVPLNPMVPSGCVLTFSQPQDSSAIDHQYAPMMKLVNIQVLKTCADTACGFESH